MECCYPQDRLSPGPRARSTASIAGCSSNIGSGISVSSVVSVSPPIPRPMTLSEWEGRGDEWLEDRNDEMIDGERDVWLGDQGCVGMEVY